MYDKKVSPISKVNKNQTNEDIGNDFISRKYINYHCGLRRFENISLKWWTPIWTQFEVSFEYSEFELLSSLLVFVIYTFLFNFLFILNVTIIDEC